ncbi:MAG: DUF3991 and TOPRIM domain-containing protein [Bacilli bacterium]|nr:DUF3991 and TOPRIM domain-containing protein [Bacilli bacterium]
MAYFTPEQISRAKEIDLLTYLQNYNPDELVYESRNTYHTRTHDSLKINNGMWYWFSRNIGGKNALEYLIQVEEYKFTDAVSHLLNQKGLEKRYIPKQILTEKEKIDRLDLPKKASNNYKIMSYLQSRGISKNIIDECINKGYIYQEYPKNNVVFVGFDEENNPRYAGVRGTNSSRYMHDAYGSDKAYSFKLKSVVKNNSVHLFESAIDLLSYATFKELKNEKWDEENLLSLAGIYSPGKDILNSKVPKTVSTFLKNNSNVDTIYIHFDNDTAGRIATQALINSFSESYKIINDPPKSGKDFNDYLCDFLQINRHKCYENYR